MGTSDADRILDRATERTIRIKSWQLAHTAGFSLDDQQDIEQDLRLHLLRRVKDFDPTKGTWSAFASSVVNNKVMNMAKARNAEKRSHSCEAFSLDEKVEGGEGTLQCRSESIGVGHLDLLARPQTWNHDLQIDLGRAVHGLPEPLAELCLRLCTERVSDISRDTGIPRGTLYDMIGRIRLGLQDSGLSDYL